VLESGDHVSHLYTDGSQYFQYDKRLLDMFQSSDLCFSVDDHMDYSANGHSLIIKSREGALLGVRELVSLQRRCANNLNQVAIHANTQGVYPEEISALQRDYAALWEPLSELLKQLAAIVENS